MFSILTVCTGNICRSPLAELLLAKELADITEIRVSSAGTMGLVGKAMPEQSQAIARSLGVENPENHDPRRLTEQLLQESDLILAMDRGHKTAIVELNPRVTKRVFTIREFARLAKAITNEELFDEVESSQVPKRLKEGVIALGLGRGLLPPLENPEDADVVDPYRKSDEVYQESTEQLLPAVRQTVEFMRRVVAAQ